MDGNQLAGILAVLSQRGNQWTGQNANRNPNNQTGFGLGSAIGAAYANAMPLRKLNAGVSIGRNQGVAQIRSAQAAADAQKEMARQQTEQQRLKTSAMSAILSQLMGGYGGNPATNLRSFTTDYGAGIGR